MSTELITFNDVIILPWTYQAAVRALAECERVDECRDWADKAAALAVYQRQAEDPTIYNFAMRIKARAVRRAGELLKEFDARGGDRTKTEAPRGSAPSQREVAKKAGLSDHQQIQAVRVANIPTPEFETLIEAPTPPTVTALAEMGRVPRKTYEPEKPFSPPIPPPKPHRSYPATMTVEVRESPTGMPIAFRYGERITPAPPPIVIPTINFVADWGVALQTSALSALSRIPSEFWPELIPELQARAKGIEEAIRQRIADSDLT
jgi:hypothetical protein